MNQNKMRDLLAEAVLYLHDHSDDGPFDAGHQSKELCELIYKIEQALAAPERELVRLTEDEITAIVREAAKGSALNRDGGTSQRIADAIMDAMIAKNGGKL